MYESHFGFSGTPFNLNPDPAFYFQSKGHGNALSYLRFGVYQGEGFVVVTGEIGAGKTTLVRTLLSELDDQKIVAAQIVSTQLEAGDLLRSVAIAFGIAPKDLSKAELIASIEAFLTLLVTQNKRALLIVDEAQNLQLQAIEELRMLSNFQLGNHALLQSFLVGQPELRTLLTSKPMEQLRQRVIASCHVGPMDAQETREYIEHRLRKVGWNDRPQFESEAFDRIYEEARGIPRRVNLLCNRLMLSAYLSDSSVIDRSSVDTIATELRGEVGERAAGQDAAVPAIDVSTVPLVGRQRGGGAYRERDSTRPLESAARGTSGRAGALLCVAATRSDDIKMAMLIRAIQRRGTGREAILVRVGDRTEFAANDEFFERIGVDVPTIDLESKEGNASLLISDVMKQFEPIVSLHEPEVVVLVGANDSSLACGIVASKSGIRMAHVDAGLRGPSRDAPQEINRMLLDRLADVCCASDAASYDTLIAEGANERNVLLAGSLLTDAALLANSFHIASHASLAQLGVPQRRQFEENGYCVVLIGGGTQSNERQYLANLIARLRKVSREIPLIWPVPAALGSRIDALGLRRQLRDDRIATVGPLGYAELVGLVASARCVVTDSRDVQTEAAALGVPILMLGMRHDHSPVAELSLKSLVDRRPETVPSARVSRATGRALEASPPDDSVSQSIADYLENWMAITECVEVAGDLRLEP